MNLLNLDSQINCLVMTLNFLICFNISGGLTAVIYTDTLSAFVMVLGALVVAIKGIPH